MFNLIRREQGFFGLPWPFCGARSLSLLRMLPSSGLRFLFRFYLSAAPRPHRTSAHRRSPSASLTRLLTEVGKLVEGPWFSIPSSGEDAPRQASLPDLDGLLSDELRSTVIRGSPSVLGGGRIPPGDYPLPSSLASTTRHHVWVAITISGAPGRRWRPVGDFDEVR